jgi:hypothetical protein
MPQQRYRHGLFLDYICHVAAACWAHLRTRQNCMDCLHALLQTNGEWVLAQQWGSWPAGSACIGFCPTCAPCTRGAEWRLSRLF